MSSFETTRDICSPYLRLHVLSSRRQIWASTSTQLPLHFFQVPRAASHWWNGRHLFHTTAASFSQRVGMIWWRPQRVEHGFELRAVICGCFMWLSAQPPTWGSERAKQQKRLESNRKMEWVKEAGTWFAQFINQSSLSSSLQVFTLQPVVSISRSHGSVSLCFLCSDAHVHHPKVHLPFLSVVVYLLK